MKKIGGNEKMTKILEKKLIEITDEAAGIDGDLDVIGGALIFLQGIVKDLEDKPNDMAFFIKNYSSVQQQVRAIFEMLNESYFKIKDSNKKIENLSLLNISDEEQEEQGRE